MARVVAVWLVGSGAGVALLALPDEDARVFSLSAAHGPSPVDLVGMAVLLLCWLPVPALLWSERALVRGAARRAAGVLAVAGAVLLPVTLAAESTTAWVPAALLLVAAQATALVAVTRGPGRAAGR